MSRRPMTAIAALALTIGLNGTPSVAIVIQPTFVNGSGQVWDDPEKQIINQAIADWQNLIRDNQTINVTFDFVPYGAGSTTLAEWSSSFSLYSGTDVYPWTTGVDHSIHFNVNNLGNAWWNLSDNIPYSSWDALSVVRHELGHLFGFADQYYYDNFNTPSQIDKWGTHITGATFDPGGLNVAMFSASDLGHLADQNDLMNPTLVLGHRRGMSATDLNMLMLAYGYRAVVDVTWTGGANSAWTPGTGNWKTTTGGVAATYFDGVNVTFNDSATGTTTANISANVAPASVTFNNSTKNFTITGTAGIIGAAAGVKKQGTGTVTIGSVNTYGGVTTVEAGKLVLQGTTKAMVPVLNNGGADIKGGMLVLDYTGGANPSATVNSLITTSYNAVGPNHFNTGKFRSSTADVTHGLGWFDNTATSKISIAYTIYGDVDLSGTVGLSDLGKVLTNWNVGARWADGDVDYNANVGLSDLGKVLTNWGQSVGSLPPVPEPSAVGMLIIAIVALVALTCRRC